MVNRVDPHYNAVHFSLYPDNNLQTNFPQNEPSGMTDK